MNEVKRNCRVKIVHAMCECGGEFRRSEVDIVLTTCPVQYPHTCDKCGKVSNPMSVYPHLEYEEVEDEANSLSPSI